MLKLVKVLGVFALTIVGLIVGLPGIATLQRAPGQGVPVELLGDGKVFVEDWDKGFVHTKGTWTIDGERSTAPLNLSSIVCVRDQRLCHVADASVSKGVGSAYYLNADVDWYTITRWDEATIEYESEAVYVTHAYVISRATEKLTGRRLKKDDAKGLCNEVQSDLKLSFVNGFDVVQALKAERPSQTASLVIATAFVLLMLAWAWRVIRKS